MFDGAKALLVAMEDAQIKLFHVLVAGQSLSVAFYYAAAVL